MGPFLRVVFPQAVWPDRALHLGARNVAALAHRSTDELRLEIHVADGTDEHPDRGHLAFHAARNRALDRLHPFGGGTLPCPGPRFVHEQKSFETGLSLRRLIT